MHFQPTATVRFSRVFYRLIDNLYSRANGHIIEQIFNIIVAQANTALAHPETNAKIGIGTVNGIEPANVDSI